MDLESAFSPLCIFTRRSLTGRLRCYGQLNDLCIFPCVCFFCFRTSRTVKRLLHSDGFKQCGLLFFTITSSSSSSSSLSSAQHVPSWIRLYGMACSARLGKAPFSTTFCFCNNTFLGPELCELFLMSMPDAVWYLSLCYPNSEEWARGKHRQHVWWKKTGHDNEPLRLWLGVLAFLLLKRGGGGS